MDSLRQTWSKSKVFRALLILALVWVVIRLAFQIIYAAGLFPELTGSSGLPEDLPVYIHAAQNFQLRQDIYPQDLSNTSAEYPYSPPFAMLSEILLWLPAVWVSIIATLVNVLACILIYTQWIRILKRLNLEAVQDKMVWTIPAWLIFSAFWGDIFFLNAGILVALAATLLIRCILEDRLGWAVLWLTCLLISKIMWAFPLALPLLLGRRKFFFKLLGLAGLAYLASVGVSVLAAGPAYVVRQYGAYFSQLDRLGTDFPWHVWSQTHYLGYNHSIKQIVVFILGDQPWVLALATAIKIVFLIPLGVVCWRLLRKPQIPALLDPKASGRLTLELIFALYLGTFIWLDIVWEALLGIVIFVYLLATLDKGWIKGLVVGVFMVYAFVDMIQLLSYVIGGDSVVQMQSEYVLTDPTIYVPLIMLVILGFYAIIMRRLWQTTRTNPGKPG
jgi:hypothetical protein